MLLMQYNIWQRCAARLNLPSNFTEYGRTTGLNYKPGYSWRHACKTIPKITNGVVLGVVCKNIRRYSTGLTKWPSSLFSGYPMKISNHGLDFTHDDHCLSLVYFSKYDQTRRRVYNDGNRELKQRSRKPCFFYLCLYFEAQLQTEI